MTFARLAPLALVAVLAGCAAATGAPTGPAADAISQRTAGMESHDGFIPLHYDRESGKVLMEVRRLDEDLLYLNTLATGLGTTSPLLDRGQVGTEALVRFERHGPRVLLVRQNTAFRATEGSEALARSVEESFPTSVLAAFPIEAEAGDGILVDATSFLLSDVFDVAGRIRGAGLGTVRLDGDRSFVDRARTGAFPTNSEVQVALTYATDDPNWALRQHAPDGRSITLRQQHSFVELPEPAMRPRRFDPRAGLFSVGFHDFARGFDEDYRQRYVSRWRLEKRDPEADMSEPVEPIVYYLDPGVPEPYRTAFIEGGMWWNEIFEAAGFRDAFRIEELPEDVDPMDARYSVIHWVHRSEPGPSVGPSYRDPRTGEILRTVIRMDSHRSLVNYAIYAGMRPALGPAPEVDAEAFAMARRRQHSAHEIGHTLGIAHNFIAASQGRASVMDYPYALVGLDAEGRLDLSDAYREGGGAFDTLAIRYAYTPFAEEEEAAGLERIVRESLTDGVRFITGGHASPAGSIPEATQWVEGATMLDALDRTSAVRDVLLSAFDERAVDPGEPLAILGDRFRHVYLHHRYALHGVTKAVGGMDYSYALRGDGQLPTQVVDPALQREALDRLVAAISPEGLAVPPRIVEIIPPAPFGYGGDTWGFDTPAGTALDPVALARSLAAEVVDGVLHRERAARLVSFHARDASHPSLDEVVERLVAATWAAGGATGADMDAALRRVSQRAVVDGLLTLAADERATVDARATAEHQLAGLAERLRREGAGSGPAAAHRELARRDIERFLERPTEPVRRSVPVPMPLPWP